MENAFGRKLSLDRLSTHRIIKVLIAQKGQRATVHLVEEGVVCLNEGVTTFLFTVFDIQRNNSMTLGHY